MNIAICDDQQEFINSIHKFTDEYYALKGGEYIVDEFSCGNELLKSDKKYDAVFLDIELGDANGIDIAKEFQSKSSGTVIIIVTSHRGYLDEAMDIKAARFIDKPVSRERVFSALDRAAFEVENNMLIVHTKDNSIVITNKGDIVFAEARLRRTMLVTVKGIVTAREGINQIKERLSSSSFAVPHNSYVVNMNYIRIFKRDEVLLNSGDKEYNIPVSTRRQPDFKKAYIRFIGEGR